MKPFTPSGMHTNPYWILGNPLNFNAPSSSELDVEKVGQNFDDHRVVMQSLNIFVWNARGAASKYFCRIFIDFKLINLKKDKATMTNTKT